MISVTYIWNTLLKSGIVTFGTISIGGIGGYLIRVWQDNKRDTKNRQYETKRKLANDLIEFFTNKFEEKKYFRYEQDYESELKILANKVQPHNRDLANDIRALIEKWKECDKYMEVNYKEIHAHYYTKNEIGKQWSIIHGQLITLANRIINIAQTWTKESVKRFVVRPLTCERVV